MFSPIAYSSSVASLSLTKRRCTRQYNLAQRPATHTPRHISQRPQQLALTPLAQQPKSTSTQGRQNRENTAKSRISFVPSSGHRRTMAASSRYTISAQQRNKRPLFLHLYIKHTVSLHFTRALSARTFKGCSEGSNNECVKIPAATAGVAGPWRALPAYKQAWPLRFPSFLLSGTASIAPRTHTWAHAHDRAGPPEYGSALLTPPTNTRNVDEQSTMHAPGLSAPRELVFTGLQLPPPLSSIEHRYCA